MFVRLGAALRDNFVSLVYVSSKSTFRIHIVTLFFRKETVFLVLVTKQKEATKLSVGNSFDNVWRSCWIILDIPWTINFDPK
jgi:hypothetical protein